MIDPIVLTICPDGHFDGPRNADPADPELARCEVLVYSWHAVAESFDTVSAMMGAHW